MFARGCNEGLKLQERLRDPQRGGVYKGFEYKTEPNPLKPGLPWMLRALANGAYKVTRVQ